MPTPIGRWAAFGLVIAIALSSAALARGNGRLLYVTDRGAIFSSRPDGTGVRKLVEADAGPPVWSPGRDKIAFLRSTDQNAQLWVMSPGGGDRFMVAEGIEYMPPSWSPDGSRLTLVRAIDDPSTSGLTKQALYTVAIDGTDERFVAEAPDRDLFDPQWSPLGTHIAFVASTPYEDGDPLTRNDRNHDIYSVRLSDGAVLRLTEDTDYDLSPTWAPDGERLAFMTDRDDTLCPPDGDGCPYTTEVYVMRADGSDQTRLTHNRDKHDREPTWSPDGTRIAWTQSIDDDVNGTCCYSEVFVMRADGTQQHRLTRNEKRIDGFPDFSPNGEWIVFAGGRYEPSRNTRELYKVRVNGASMTQITHTDGRREIAPDW